jgi:hypothetical protein
MNVSARKSEADDGASLSYAGEPLSLAQAEETRRFVEWLRCRNS